MPLPSEWVHRTTDLKWSTNTHGDESCQATLDVTTDEAVSIIVNNKADPVVIVSPLGEPLYQGRLDDPSLALGEEGAFSFASMGGWAALSDLEESYTALWSTTDYGAWHPATTQEQATRTAEKGEFDQRGRLYIAPRKGESFSNAGFVLAQTYQTPQAASGGRPVVGIQFNWEFKAPTNWQFLVTSFNRAYTSQTIVYTINATGAVLSGAVRGLFSPGVDRLEFALYYNAAAANYTGETGVDAYLEITNLRLTSSSANQINTTLTGAVSAGSNVTASVGSTARMYVGQRLIINSSLTSGVSESVIVESIPSSTQFVADFALAHASGQSVQAHQVYASEIASDLAAFVNGVNSDQLAASGSVTATSLDLVDCVYEDVTPADVLNDLCTKSGDGTVWETGVDSGVLYLRPRGQRGRAWAIDVDAITLTTSLADLVNSAYAIYENANGDTVRSTITADSTSVIEHGITRRRSISVKALSATQAQEAVDALLDDKATLGARATIPNITALYDLYGTRWPLWEANAGRGDTITIRNVSPEVASGLEARLTFRLSRTTYDAKADTLTVELEAPRPGL